METEQRFRLRKANRIVGFVRRMPTGGDFYSRDGFWWTGSPLDYEQIDEWTGWRDINRQFIFEYDIVRCKIDPDGPYEKAAVLWDKKKERFCMRFLERDLHVPLQMDGIEMFNQRQIKVVSYLFINPEIMDEWGIEDE
jgi:hypothetical protein